MGGTPTADTGIPLATRASFLVFPIMTGFAQGGLLPILPTIKDHLADTPGAAMFVRFLVTGVGVAMILGAPFAGLVAKTFGWRRSLVGTVLVFSFAGAAGGLIDNLWWMVLTRLLVGVSVAILGALLMAIMTLRLDGGERDRWIGYVVFAGVIGMLVITPMSGFIGSVDWRLPFAFHLVGLLSLLVILPGIQEPQVTDTAEQGSPKPQRTFALWPIGLGLLIGVLVHAENTFVPFHMANIGIRDPRTISLILVASVPVTAVLSFSYGAIRRHASMKTIFVVASAMSAAGFVMIGLSQGMTSIIMGIIALGIGGAVLCPNMFAFAASLSSPENRARDIGAVRGAFSAGPFVGQMALEPVAAISGPGTAIASLCLVSLVAFVGFATIMKRQTAVVAV